MHLYLSLIASQEVFLHISTLTSRCHSGHVESREALSSFLCGITLNDRLQKGILLIGGTKSTDLRYQEAK